MNYQEAKDELIKVLSLNVITSWEKPLIKWKVAINQDKFTDESIIALCMAAREWRKQGTIIFTVQNICHDLLGWQSQEEEFIPLCQRFFNDVQAKEEGL